MLQNLMREYMRNNDRALSNIEALPGGFNALRQLYENVQVSSYVLGRAVGAHFKHCTPVVHLVQRKCYWCCVNISKVAKKTVVCVSLCTGQPV